MMVLAVPDLAACPVEFTLATDPVRTWPDDTSPEVDLSRQMSWIGPQALPLTTDSVTASAPANAGRAPVAPSLTPLWVALPVTISDSVTRRAQITCHDVGLSLRSVRLGDPPTVTCTCGQCASHPSCRLAALPGTLIDGSHELALDTQRIRGTSAQAIVGVQLFVRYRGLRRRFDSGPLPAVMLAGRL
jgi:hypothetical protein